MYLSRVLIISFGASILLHGLVLFAVQAPLQGAIRAGAGGIEILLSITRGRSGELHTAERVRSEIKQPQLVSKAPRKPQSATPKTDLRVRDAGHDQIDGIDAATRSGGSTPRAELNYFARVQDWLERHKRYPLQARKYRQQGTVELRFTMDDKGNVLTHAIGKSSGYIALDDEVEDMLQRASPLPIPPQGLPLAGVELVIPVSFNLQ